MTQPLTAKHTFILQTSYTVNTVNVENGKKESKKKRTRRIN